MNGCRQRKVEEKRKTKQKKCKQKGRFAYWLMIEVLPLLPSPIMTSLTVMLSAAAIVAA